MNTITHSATFFPNTPTSANQPVNEAVGLEETDSKDDNFSAIEQTSETNPDNSNPNLNSRAGDDNRQTNQQHSEQEIAVIRDLATRDREVRAHEQAHASVGGQYAGAASFTYQRGPNGVSYAVGGEVSISAPSGGDAQSRLQAAEQIKRAALAPANPSAQDRQVAAQASQTATQARAEIATQASQQRTPAKSAETSNSSESQTSEKQSDSAHDLPGSKSASKDQTYLAIASNNEPGAVFNQLV